MKIQSLALSISILSGEEQELLASLLAGGGFGKLSMSSIKYDQEG
ncbi:hypothetical protein J2Z48_001755 [Croceifilum oryzae]|uniref:Uncharacterized protein n=1 Tax=Croceifilum oryzae TaxID=1553429 RepID=A0AAJ1WQI2_9BACL|nr:hypothetical protein [Croceifilum oryzae]MDQ0417582.1 hypothetical protein [Croceifilum oryzae]